MAIKLEVNVTEVCVVSREVEVKVDLTKLTHDILRSLLAHGVSQKIGDAASAATAQAVESEFGADKTARHPDAKAWLETESGKRKVQDIARAMMEKAVESLYAGNWVSRQGTGLRIEADPVVKLAHDKAKAVLMEAIFKPFAAKAGIKPTLENLATCGQAKVEAFFTTKAKRAVWNESTVGAWAQAQADAGKRDYLAEAREELAAIASAAPAGDLDDMLADL